MKKLFFSAIVMIAFSVTSFAAENGNVTIQKESETIHYKSVESVSDTECETYRKGFTIASADENGDLVLTFHYYWLVICDDGFVGIVE